MTQTDRDPFDLIGAGFGPSNLSLAIALQESRVPVRARFLEARGRFAWHPGMMIPGADMQISFLKDLVSQRNPQSPYTFISYLHSKGRLSRFINRKTFFPSRSEFNDYLSWVAGQFPVCDYDRRVVGIEPVERHGKVREVEVITQSASGEQARYLGRNLVIAPGGRPRIPAPFDEFRSDPRVVHSNDYLHRVVPDLRPGMRIAILGGGQSAAEIFADLAARPEAPKIDLTLRGRALRPSDDTPFVNEIFDPEQTDRFHALPDAARRMALSDLAATNYAVVDEDLIQAIYDSLYEQSVEGGGRLSLDTGMRVAGVNALEDGLQLVLDGPSGVQSRDYDRVILATGYTRELDSGVLHGLARFCDDPVPGRDYRLPMAQGFLPAVFVQGYSEPTHGLSDTLLSVLALRSQEIAANLSQSLAAQKELLAAE